MTAEQRRASATLYHSLSDRRGDHIGRVFFVHAGPQARCFLKNAIVRSHASLADASW
jgi:hypothetical protein